MRIKVYISPCERADAISAYHNYLTVEQRNQIQDAADDVWFILDIDANGVANVEVDQAVEDEKRAPKHP